MMASPPRSCFSDRELPAGRAHHVPFTAACRSEVIKSSIVTVENLSPKDSWLLLTRATLWLRTALTTTPEVSTGRGLYDIHVPPNSITFSQKFANDVRTNKARGTSNLAV